MATWNSIPHQVTDASSKIKEQIMKIKNRLKYTLWNSRDCEATQT
jgi:hypothetical protein